MPPHSHLHRLISTCKDDNEGGLLLMTRTNTTWKPAYEKLTGFRTNNQIVFRISLKTKYNNYGTFTSNLA